MKYYKITAITFHLEFGSQEKIFTLVANSVDEAIKELHKNKMVIQITKIDKITSYLVIRQIRRFRYLLRKKADLRFS